MLVGGCCNIKSPLPVRPGDATLLLSQHPQFSQAARAAPDFVNDAFRVITKLENDLANAGR